MYVLRSSAVTINGAVWPSTLRFRARGPRRQATALDRNVSCSARCSVGKLRLDPRASCSHKTTLDRVLTYTHRTVHCSRSASTDGESCLLLTRQACSHVQQPQWVDWTTYSGLDNVASTTRPLMLFIRRITHHNTCRVSFTAAAASAAAAAAAARSLMLSLHVRPSPDIRCRDVMCRDNRQSTRLSSIYCYSSALSFGLPAPR